MRYTPPGTPPVRFSRALAFVLPMLRKTRFEAGASLKIVPKSGLGILREPKLGGVSQSFNELPPELKALARKPQLLVLTKANSRKGQSEQ